MMKRQQREAREMEEQLIEQAKFEVQQENHAHLTKEEIDRILSRSTAAKTLDVTRLDAQGFGKMRDNLESLFDKNQQMRMEFAKEPEKYFETDGDLHAFLKDI